MKSKTLFDSFHHAKDGVYFGIGRERNIRIQLAVFVIALIVGWYVRISSTEWALVLIAGGSVIALEFMNSALEFIEDILHPKLHVAVGRSKDLSAAAVLTASVMAIGIGVIIFLPHLIRVLQ